MWAEIPDARGYFVSVWPIDATQTDPEYQAADPDANTARRLLENLEPGILYNIEVRPNHDNNLPEFSATQRTSKLFDKLSSKNYG